MEHEWCPTTISPDTADTKAAQMAAAQAAVASALATYNSWLSYTSDAADD